MKRLLIFIFLTFFAFACDEGLQGESEDGVNFRMWLQIDSILTYFNIEDFYYVPNPSALSLQEYSIARDFINYHGNSYLNEQSCLDVEIEPIIDSNFPYYTEDFFGANAYRIRITSGCRMGYPINPQWVGEVRIGIGTYTLFADTINGILFNALSKNPSFTYQNYIYFDEYGNML